SNGPYVQLSQASLQQAINAMEVCRTNTGSSVTLLVPPGLYSGAGGITIPQTSGTAATSPLIIRSTQDSHLPDHQTVCSHGIQDNLASSTDPGIDNPACNGSGMYYQLGTTLTDIAS